MEAVYENGVLKPSTPRPWKDGERVRVAISSLDSPLLKAYGIMGFQGTAEEAESYLAAGVKDFNLSTDVSILRAFYSKEGGALREIVANAKVAVGV